MRVCYVLLLPLLQFHTAVLGSGRLFDFHANVTQLLESLRTHVVVILIGAVVADDGEVPVVAYLLHGEEDIAQLEGYEAANTSRFKPSYEGDVMATGDGYRQWMSEKNKYDLRTSAGRAAFIQRRGNIVSRPATQRFSWGNLLDKCPNTRRK